MSDAPAHIPQKVQFQPGGIPMPLLQLLLGVLVAGGTGFGAAKLSGQTAGHQAAEIQELQRLASSNKAEIDYLRSVTATKEQTQLLIKMVEDSRSDMKDIRRELSEIRQGR